MAPLITNWHIRDVSWSKYRSENMKSDKYYLRRQRFSAYSLAFFIAIPLEPLGGIVFKRMMLSCLPERKKSGTCTTKLFLFYTKGYHKLQDLQLPDFPNARFDAADIYATFIFVVAAAISMALLFELAYHFDLFWPERIESPCMQWIWKTLAILLTTAHGAASITSLHVVTQRSVGIRGVADEAVDAIRAGWDQKASLVYRDSTSAVICVILGWVSLACAAYR